MGAPSACHPPPVLRLGALAQGGRSLVRQGSRQHTCHELPRTCLWRRQYVLSEPLPRALARLRVRGVHIGFDEQRIDSLGLFRQRLNASDPPVSHWSTCVPLVWWPLWGYNIGEFFQSSVLPVAELLAAKIMDRNIMLVPEVGGWPLKGFHHHLLRPFSSHPIRSSGQLAPRCTGTARCPEARCFERILVCRFRDVYDHRPPIAPWSAARAIVESFRKPGVHTLVPRRSSLGPEAPFVVLFATRRAAKNGARLITNEAKLVERCGRWRPLPGCLAASLDRAAAIEDGSGRVQARSVCSTHSFGARSLRADVEMVRDADVLIGTHGAALVHAIFMQSGGALIEVRPYGFEGRWPDQYHYSMARQQNETHVFVISTLNRYLCSPLPPANVTAWDARPLNTYVNLTVFDSALAAAACTSGRGGSGLGIIDHPSVLPVAAVSPFAYGSLHSVYFHNI